MQLRVPKKYRPNQPRRRRVFSGRLFWLFVFAAIFSVGAYMVLQNPEPFREGAMGLGENAWEQVQNARSEVFPVQPTATPDVRQELVACDNAYLVGKLEDVIRICSQTLPGLPNDVGIYYRVAYTMVISSNGGDDITRINDALEMAERTIAANPESALGWSVKAMALDFLLKHNLALASAQRALEIDPNLTIAKAHLGNIYRNLGQRDLAKTTLESALADLQNRGADSETQAQVYRNYGRYLALVEGDYDGAIDFYQRARQTMPSHVYIAIEMARLYLLMGVSEPSNTQLAAQILQETLAVAPRDTSVLFMLGDYHINRGEAPQAIDYYTRCIETNADYVPCLSRMGQIYYSSQNSASYPLAVQNLSRATELGSTDPYDWYLLGRAYFRMGQCNNAAAPLREGYRLRQELNSTQVALEDFNNAFRECNIPVQ